MLVPVQLPLFKLRNLYSLNLHILLLTVLGIIPFKKDSIRSNIYAFSILGTFVVATIVTAILLFFIFPDVHGTVEKFLEAATLSFLFVLFSCFLYSNGKTLESWKNLLNMFSKFDENFPNNKLSTSKIALITLKFLLINLTPLLYYATDIFIWNLKTDIKAFTGLLFHVIQNIGLVYDVQISTFFWELSSVFQSRYKYLEKHLEDTLLNKIPNEQMSQVAFEHTMVTIKYKYKLLYNAIEEINVIFGWILLFVLTHVTVVFLRDFYDTLYTSGMKYEFYVQGFFFALLIAVSFYNYTFVSNLDHLLFLKIFK